MVGFPSRLSDRLAMDERSAGRSSASMAAKPGPDDDIKPARRKTEGAMRSAQEQRFVSLKSG
jgi:hypothetical protein